MAITIQYLATSVWNKKTSLLLPQHELNEEIDNELLRKYFDVNEIFDLNDRAPKKQESICENIAFPDVYESREGKIFRLLDDNFGILRVEDNLVLFDTCDFWIDTSTTASRRGLKIGQIVGLGSTVVFHACRLEEKTVCCRKCIISKIYVMVSSHARLFSKCSATLLAAGPPELI